ncbi:CAP domain-containing protein [Brumimicrobium aurantiacum]|uniref:CAP domain-containing protein n=1 Tax=Brumimicrobium aurantiacum TaxID=1737063 RepID=A0A3E1F091_9FLAO|nr:CAP domain-containing protein [Brumimicrobium aurantiacum]RFC55231.1 CAP domain-containing protein [Brumimicrobium aurantiacum]
MKVPGLKIILIITISNLLLFATTLHSQVPIYFESDVIADTLYFGLPTGEEDIPQEFKEEEQAMMNLINAERKRFGLKPLKIDTALSAACRYHAYDMATQNYISHTGYDRGKDGKRKFANSTFERISQFYDATTLINENIAFGSKNVEDMFNLWVESDGHYKNMLAPNSRVAGIGLVYIPESEYKYYWVYNSAE